MSHYTVQVGGDEATPIVMETIEDVNNQLDAMDNLSQGYIDAVLAWATFDPEATEPGTGNPQLNQSLTIGHGDERPADVWRYSSN